MQTQNNITGVEFLSNLNALLSSTIGLNRNIRQALKKLGEYQRADQVYIVNINHDMTFTVSEEWTKTGESIFPETEKKRSFYYDRKLEEDLERDNYIYIPDIDSVTNESLKNIMKAMQVHCAVFLPLYISSHLFSFLCLSRCQHEEVWSKEELDFLVQVAAILSGALEKELLLSKLTKHHALYHDFIENRVDYILRLNRHLHISFSNKTFFSLFGESPDEIIGCQFGDLMSEMDISSKQLEEVSKRSDKLLTFHATVTPCDKVLFIEWNAYPVKLNRDQVEIHLIGHDVTKYHYAEAELDLLRTQLKVFSENMFPLWKSIKDDLLNNLSEEMDGDMKDLRQKTITFDQFYEEFLSKIDYKFTSHAH